VEGMYLWVLDGADRSYCLWEITATFFILGRVVVDTESDVPLFGLTKNNYVMEI
jgi:hypothetical protein